MKLTPSYDVAIVCLQQKIEIYFAEIPDMQIVNDLHNLQYHHKNIELISESHSQRLHYAIKISPVFDLENAARTISNCLCKEHRLNVRLVFDRSPEKLIAVRTSGS